MKKIRGSLYFLDETFGRERIRRELDAQQDAGFDLVWVNGPPFRLEALEALQANVGAFDPIACLMDEAEARGMRVILEIMAREDWYVHWNLSGDLETSRKLTVILAQKYGCHPAFFGYYLGNEIYIVHGEQRTYCYTLWKSVAKWCKQETPGCKIVLSPFFVSDTGEELGYTYEKPEAYASFWRELLADTRIDILMLQDSGAEHAAFFGLAEREPYFAAVARACSDTGVELWGNVELAEIDVRDYTELKAFRADYGVNGAGFDDPHWIQVPISKLQNKAELASRYCAHLISWGFQQFVSPESGKVGSGTYFEAFQTWNRAET